MWTIISRFIACFQYFRYVKDATLLQNLAQSMEEIIFNVADMTFFFNDLEDCDQVISQHSYGM